MIRHHTPSRPRPARRTMVAVVAVGALGLLATACGDDEESTSTEAPATAAPATDAPAEEVPAGEILVEGAWARNSPMAVENGAAYMTITSPVDDKLTGAKVDPSVAAMAQVHETVMADGGMTGDTMAMGGESTMPMGEMTMQEVEFIELLAGQPVELKPGGYHIMLMGLAAPLELGTTIQITLVFEQAGEVTVDVPVLEEAP